MRASKKKSRLLLAGVVTALVLLSTAGAHALPTKLCNANEATCSKENTWQLWSENFKGTIATANLKMPSYFTASCGAGKFGSTLSEGEGPLTGEVFKWNFFSCSPESCSVATPATEGTGFSAEVEATSGGNGTMRVGNSPTLVISCTSPKVTCTYAAEAMELSVQGGTTWETATISTTSELVKDFFKSSPSCTWVATFEAEYGIVEPGRPLYVTH